MDLFLTMINHNNRKVSCLDNIFVVQLKYYRIVQMEMRRMGDLLNILINSNIFAELPETVILDEILPHGQVQRYGKGQYLIQHQQLVNRFAVILSGRVNIMHIFPEGSSSLMTVLTDGAVLAADLIFTRTRISPYHAMAVAETCVVYFPVELLTTAGLLTESWRQAVLNNLLMLISQENIKKEYRLAILSQRGLRERIMTFLTMQANRIQDTTVRISFSREELASYLCVNRSALSHELSMMQQEGLITFRKNVFTIHKI